MMGLVFAVTRHNASVCGGGAIEREVGVCDRCGPADGGARWGDDSGGGGGGGATLLD